MIERRPILVTGRSGQLARCLVESAATRNIPLVAIGRPSLNFADPRTIEPTVMAVMPRAIINTAAYTAVDDAEREIGPAFAINRDGAKYIAQIAARLRIPFIQMSTDYVFDGLKPSPYVENDAVGPLGVYGQSKLEGEIAVREAWPEAVILRCAWLFSPHAKNFLRTMVEYATTREVVTVVNDQYGAPTYACELASTILDIVSRLADNHESHPGIYHLSAAGETTWYGFAETIFRGLRERNQPVSRLEPIRSEHYPTPAQRPANSRLDSGKIHAEFGISLSDWQTFVEDCLDRVLAMRADEDR